MCVQFGINFPWPLQEKQLNTTKTGLELKVNDMSESKSKVQAPNP